MKTLIIYASVHHGNTAKVACAMADELGAALAKPSEVDVSRIGDYDLIGFGSGIYNHSHHRALLELADRLLTAGKPVFIFSTRGYGRPLPAREDDHKELREKLMAKGYTVTGEFACKGWSTFYRATRLFGGINRGSPGPKELSRAREFVASLRTRQSRPANRTEIIDAGVNPFSRAYILKGKKTVIVDTGIAGQAGRILDTLRKNCIRKGDVSLILLTHGHWDHYGNAMELKEALGAPIAIGKADAGYLARGMDAPVVPRTVRGLLFKLFTSGKPDQVIADLVIDGETDLSPYGVDAIAFPTPGHTFGSLSVATADGCLIGDLLMRMPPFGRVPGMPAFAEDARQIGPSLKKVLDRQPKMIYPTHGDPCETAAIRKRMARLIG